jgi:hypothetical protein
MGFPDRIERTVEAYRTAYDAPNRGSGAGC